MVRYCKICGQKSGRCNHLMVDLGEREEDKGENRIENKSDMNGPENRE